MQAQPSAPPAQGLTFHKAIETGPHERSIGRYDFEGGAFVRIVASPDLATEEALDMVETLIELKRKELARTSKAANRRQADSIPDDADDEALS